MILQVCSTPHALTATLPSSSLSGSVSLAPDFFCKVPPLEKGNVNEFKGGNLMKKVFSGAKETHPDILRGGHRNPYSSN